MTNEPNPPVAKEKELWLLGYRIMVAEEEEEEDDEEDGLIRKSWSMGDLATTGPLRSEVANGDCGYHSEGGLDQSVRNNGRKKGTPWTEEEHKRFLRGLEKLGKGDWRGISKNFVTSRTPTQVASHAQKYFLRQTNPQKRKRRSSLFDVAIDDNDNTSAAFPAIPSKSQHEIKEKEDKSTFIVPVPFPLSTHDGDQDSPSKKRRITSSFSLFDHISNNRKAVSMESSPLLSPLTHTSPSTTADIPPHDPSEEYGDLELRIGLPQPSLDRRSCLDSAQLLLLPSQTSQYQI